MNRDKSVNMTAVAVFLYDAFASAKFGGNVAGVVLAGDGTVDDQWLQLVARELAAPCARRTDTARAIRHNASLLR